jgi:hypothetical protein
MSIFNGARALNTITNTISIIDFSGNNVTSVCLPRTGGVITGDLILEGSTTNITFDDGSIQTKAFDDGRYERLDYLTGLTENITNVNDVLTINQDVEFKGSVLMGDSQLNISQINNLGSTLSSFSNSRATNLQNFTNSIRKKTIHNQKLYSEV